MFDFHVHSSFSEDCEVAMEDMVKAAIEKGIQELCFTEHIDKDYPDRDWTFDLDLNKYRLKIREMQSAFGHKIKVRKGWNSGFNHMCWMIIEGLSMKNRLILSFVPCMRQRDSTFIPANFLKRKVWIKLMKNIIQSYWHVFVILIGLASLVTLI